MKNYFDKPFELRYFEMNKSGIASPVTILTLLEETAADHCHSINYSLYDLHKRNVGWVLLAGVMHMYRYPNYKEKIFIRTWLSEYSTVKGIRENEIYDERQQIIGKARGLWVFFDIEKRRPVRIFEEIKNKWSFRTEKSLKQDIHTIEATNSASNTMEFTVNRYDTDMNRHVNNIRYLQWLMESVSEDITDNFYLHSINGRFISEAQYGNTMISQTHKGNSENSLTHAIKVKDTSKVCAVANTVWKNKDHNNNIVVSNYLGNKDYNPV